MARPRRTPGTSNAWARQPLRAKVQVPADAEAGCALSVQAFAAAALPESPTRAGQVWRSTLTAGAAPPPAPQRPPARCNVLVTGHENGSVTFWDVAAAVPRRIAEVPGTCGRRVVSALALDVEGGLLAVGHNGGEVRRCRAGGSMQCFTPVML